MEKKRCPVCGTEQAERCFCGQCGWDFTTDILEGGKQEKVSADEICLYHERLALLRENFEKAKKWEQIQNLALGTGGGYGVKNLEFDPRECGIDTETEQIEIPEGCEKISARAFQGFKKLRKIIMPNTVREIGERACHGCTALREIKWSYGLKKIEKEAFYGCGSLECAELPNRVEEIGRRAFGWCKQLKYVSLPESLRIIREEAWSGCMELAQVCLPEGLILLEKAAFSYCVSLQNLAIPESLSQVWNVRFEQIFAGCEQIRQIAMPDDGNFELFEQVKRCCPKSRLTFFHREEQEDADLGKFQWDRRRRDMEGESEQWIRELQAEWLGLAEPDKSYRGMIFKIPYGYRRLGMLKSARKIWMPDSVEKVEERFCEVHSYDIGGEEEELLIKWSQKLRVIEKECCAQIAIKKLRLPENLEEIGVGAFQSCRNLWQIYLPNTIRQIGADAFLNCPIREVIMENGMDREIVRQIKKKFPTAQFQNVERPEEIQWTRP